MEITREKIRQRIGKIVWRIESIPYVNWFNPLITLYLNFRSFPFRQACKLPVFVYGWPKLFSLYGSMECIGKCKTGMVTFNATNAAAPSASGFATAINNWGKIIFRGKCKIYTANKINVGVNGVLDLGDGTKIMHFCNITAYASVRVGEQSRIVHRCQVLDTNFHYIADFNKLKVPKHTRPIEIGSYCWICNSSTITGGAKIPNKTIVASNSLVNKDMTEIPEESMIGGIPAKLIGTGYRKVESKKLQHSIWMYFKNYKDTNYYPLSGGIDHNICDIDE